MQGHKQHRNTTRPQFPDTFLPSVADAADRAMRHVLMSDAGLLDELADRLPAIRTSL